MLMIVIGVLLAAFTIYHAVRYIKGSHKHRIRLVNIVLIVAAAVSFVLFEVDQKAIDSKRSEYNVHNGTILGSITYEKWDSDHLFFHETQLFSSGEFVIRASDAKLPWICRIYSPVAIYRSKDTPTDLKYERIDGKSYPLWQNIEKIVPDYAPLCIVTMIVAVLMLIMFDAVILLKKLIMKKVEGGAIADENEKKTQS